jgi:hypothetical protein
MALRKPKGEYVWCVDADDKVNENAAQIISYLHKNPSLEILAVRLRDVKEDGSYISDSCTQPTLPKNVVMKGRDAVIGGYNPSSVCALMIKKEAVDGRSTVFCSRNNPSGCGTYLPVDVQGR